MSSNGRTILSDASRTTWQELVSRSGKKTRSVLSDDIELMYSINGGTGSVRIPAGAEVAFFCNIDKGSYRVSRSGVWTRGTFFLGRGVEVRQVSIMSNWTVKLSPGLGSLNEQVKPRHETRRARFSLLSGVSI